jgi:hypothetical protein
MLQKTPEMKGKKKLLFGLIILEMRNLSVARIGNSSASLESIRADIKNSRTSRAITPKKALRAGALSRKSTSDKAR